MKIKNVIKSYVDVLENVHACVSLFVYVGIFMQLQLVVQLRHQFWQPKSVWGTGFGSKSGPGDQVLQIFFTKTGLAGPILGGTDFGVTPR